MTPMAMGMAIAKPIPLNAPRDSQTEGDGFFIRLLAGTCCLETLKGRQHRLSFRHAPLVRGVDP